MAGSSRDEPSAPSRRAGPATKLTSTASPPPLPLPEALLEGGGASGALTWVMPPLPRSSLLRASPERTSRTSSAPSSPADVSRRPHALQSSDVTATLRTRHGRHGRWGHRASAAVWR